MVRVKEDHALPDTKKFCSVWKRACPSVLKCPSIYIYWCPSMPFQSPIRYGRAKKGMSFQTLLNKVVFGRACPSLLKCPQYIS